MLRSFVLAIYLAAATPALAQNGTSAPEGKPAASPPANTVVGWTRLTIITAKGYVSLEARDDWPVVGAQSQLPVAAVGFAIPDAAADGSDAQSTNLAVTICDPESPKGKEAMTQYGAPLGGDVAKETYKTWTVYTQNATAGDLSYTIIDAVSHVADVDIGVRMAWPHLAKHTEDYDSKMEVLMLDQLDHITGDMGKFTPPEGATALRPTGQ